MSYRPAFLMLLMTAVFSGTAFLQEAGSLVKDWRLDRLKVQVKGGLLRAWIKGQEIARHVLGNVTEADHDGKIEAVNVFEDASFASAEGGYWPTWWGWYSWPYWWGHFNGVGKITWTVTPDAGKDTELGYTWHYFWR